jgi:hypothetical protein
VLSSVFFIGRRDAASLEAYIIRLFEGLEEVASFQYFHLSGGMISCLNPKFSKVGNSFIC